MSVTATRFAWELDLTKEKKRSTKRLVLLAIADRANNEGTCFPSIARIAKDTCLDRKTVMQTISDLIDLGVVADTGEKKGATKQVRVLQINLGYTPKKEVVYTVVGGITVVDNSKNTSNKLYQIWKVTVPYFPSNSTKFPCNSTKFGTQNLKQSNKESKKENTSASAVKKEVNVCLKETPQNGVLTPKVGFGKTELDETTNVELSETTLLLLEEQAHLEGKSVQQVVDELGSGNTVPPVVTEVSTDNKKQKKWIPRDEYKAMKQAEYSAKYSANKHQNKEMCVSKAMQESFKQGFGNPNATKGIPDDVLAKLPKHLRDRVKK